MAVKENSKKLTLYPVKSKSKKNKKDIVIGATIVENNNDQFKKKKNQRKIKSDGIQVKKENPNDIETNISKKKLKKKKQNNNDSLTENIVEISKNNNSGTDNKKTKKQKKQKLADEEKSYENNEISENNISNNGIKKAKKQKKRKLSEQLNSDNLSKNEISEENNLDVKKQKKEKRKLLDTDIVDSDASVSEETPQPKKEKMKTEKESEDPEVKARTVFVGNVPLKSTKKDIKKHFRKYGIIESVRIRGIPAANPKLTKRVAAIKQEFHPERNNFICYIRYKNKEDASNAEAENGVLFQEHHLRVHCCESKAKPDESKAIFIGNLSFGATEDELWKLFEVCGPISSVRIIRDTFTGMGKGFAYVNFKDSDGVQLALEMEDVKLRNRELRISLCNSSVAKKNKKLNKRKEIMKPGQSHFKKPFKKIRKSNDEDSQDDQENREYKKKVGFTPKGKRSFQGSKFTDKKKKFKKNKEFTEKKRKIDMIAPKAE